MGRTTRRIQSYYKHVNRDKRSPPDSINTFQTPSSCLILDFWLYHVLAKQYPSCSVYSMECICRVCVKSTDIIDVSDWGVRPTFGESMLVLVLGRRDSLVCWLLPEGDFLIFHLLPATVGNSIAQWQISGLFQTYKSTKIFSTQDTSSALKFWTMATPEISSIYLRSGNTSCSLIQLMYSISYSSESKQKCWACHDACSFCKYVLTLAFALLNDRFRVLTSFHLTK